jgi:hypothetical protein
MGPSLKILLAACLSVALFGAAQDQNPRGTHGTSDSCGIIREAIAEFGKIKPGMTRRKVEEHFERDGGLQFRGATRYTYSKCKDATIKVEIKFKLAGSVDRPAFSNDDTVVEVSKPYLEYFSRD